MKLYNLLGDMTYAVENDQRRAPGSRPARAPPAGPALKARLEHASNDVDTLRKKIVATKEGGMITGEERLREYLTDLYGSVVFYDGRPSQTQVDREASIAHELADVVEGLRRLDGEKALEHQRFLERAKSLPTMRLLTRESWEKSAQEGEGGGSGTERERESFERD